MVIAGRSSALTWRVRARLAYINNSAVRVHRIDFITVSPKGGRILGRRRFRTPVQILTEKIPACTLIVIVPTKTARDDCDPQSVNAGSNGYELP